MNWKEFRGNQKNDKRVTNAYLWGKVEELTDTTVRPLCYLWMVTVIERGPWWLGKSRCYIHFKKGRKNDTVNCKSVSLPAVSWKITEKDLLEAIFKHVKDKNMFGNRQHGFTKAKVCLINCCLWYYWLFVSGGGSGICHLPWIKQGLWHSLPSCNLEEAMQTGWTPNWMKNCLEHQA